VENIVENVGLYLTVSKTPVFSGIFVMAKPGTAEFTRLLQP
jgi:hypothetical protein